MDKIFLSIKYFKKDYNTGKILSDDKVLEIDLVVKLTKVIDAKPKYIKVVEKDIRLIKTLEEKFKSNYIINDM